jgi:hypothetical protein
VEAIFCQGSFVKYEFYRIEFFHMTANNRRRKNLIRSLMSDGKLLTSQEDKMNEVQHHFSQVLGTTGRRSRAVCWDHLGYTPFRVI